MLLLGVVETCSLVQNVKEEMHGDEKIGPLVKNSHNCKIMEQKSNFGAQNAIK